MLTLSNIGDIIPLSNSEGIERTNVLPPLAITNPVREDSAMVNESISQKTNKCKVNQTARFLTCLNCGKLLTYHRGKFCSDKCQAQNAYKQLEYKHICSHCGINYSSRKKDQKYCSLACANKVNVLPHSGVNFHPIEPIPSYICQGCGGVIKPRIGHRKPSKGHNYKYCSKKCAFEHYSDYGKTWNKTGEPKPRYCRVYFFNCVVCNKLSCSNTKVQKTCSDKCRRLWSYHSNPNKDLWNLKKRQKHIWKPTTSRICKWCNNKFDSSGNNVYCTPECSLLATREFKKNQNLKRKLRKTKAYVSNVIRKDIYKRDNWICQICGKKVKRDLSFPDPLSASIDHIIPLANGGTHEPKNVQLAHFICNSIKSNNVVNEQPRLL